MDILARVPQPGSDDVKTQQSEAQTRGEFLRALSHELATPLTPLVGYLKLLRSGKLGELTDRQQQVVEAMSLAAERLGRSIDNLVDFAALQTGDYRVSRMPFDASAMIDQCMSELHPKARARSVHLEARRPERLPLDADERKLHQALSNIVDNALRHSPHGGHVLVEVREVPERVVFGIYDQGPGVSEASIALIESGRRMPDEATGGSGLGLPVARQIVAAHGGELRIESPPKEQPDVRMLFPGSRVLFWIPTKS